MRRNWVVILVGGLLMFDDALTPVAHPYPHYNNFVIRLFMTPVRDSARWRLGMRTLTRGGAEGPTSFSVGRARNTINRASHPEAADVFNYGRVINNGPDMQGGNTLPADDATRNLYCNGRTGAIPLPVIEAQAVLE